jgi:hypothetical protein
MAGPVDVVKHMPPQSPPMQHIIQALIHKVKTHMEGLDADVQVTNEKIGELEAT